MVDTMAKKNITEEQVQKAYILARQVYFEEIDKPEAISRLRKLHNMNEATVSTPV